MEATTHTAGISVCFEGFKFTTFFNNKQLFFFAFHVKMIIFADVKTL